MTYARLSIAIACAAGAAVSGCANVSVNRVTSRNQPGIRYWRPAPYLALEETSEGTKVTCNAKVVMLPDKSEEYTITMNTGIGTASAKPQIQDGWNLVGLDASADSKTNENVTALAALLKVIPGIQPLSDAQPPQLARSNCHGLYRLVYDKYSGQVVGVQKVGLPGEINVGGTGSPPGKGSGKAAE